MLDNLSYRLDNRFSNARHMKKKMLKKKIWFYVETVWKRKTELFSSEEELREYIRLCSLQAIDNAWVEQVDYLQQLQYVVSGLATAQRNPVFEYHREAYDSFIRMEKVIKKDIVRNVFLGQKSYGKAGEMQVLFP